MIDGNELESIALQTNILELMKLKSDGTTRGGERAVSIARDCVRTLFPGGPEPSTDQEKLAKAAGEARFSTGSKMNIWGSEGKWRVFVSGSEADTTDPALKEKRDLIQQACDRGLKFPLEDAANKIAINQAAEILVEQRLLELAGAHNLTIPRDQAVVLRKRTSELAERETFGRTTRPVVVRTDLESIPGVKRFREVLGEVQRANAPK